MEIWKTKIKQKIIIANVIFEKIKIKIRFCKSNDENNMFQLFIILKIYQYLFYHVCLKLANAYSINSLISKEIFLHY